MISKSEQARKLKAKNPDRSNADIARELGISAATVAQALKHSAPKASGRSMSVGKVWIWKKSAQILETFPALLDEFKLAAPDNKPVAYGRVSSGLMLEVSLFDLHFGKLCWGKEVGTNYDLKIARQGLDDALEGLLSMAKSVGPIEQILYPIGNDFFNVDNRHQTTTAGTLQDVDGRWQRSFIEGRKAMANAIERLRQVAPVSVVMVSGNHDTERVFYLGDVLQAWFYKTPGVTVDNNPTQRKYYAWGKCLIGLTHGDKEAHKDLPLIMATEKPELWSAAKYREIHLGHYHKKQELFFKPTDEYRGVRVRVIPSLSPADAWHNSKGYESLRAAEAFVWDKEAGCTATFSFQP